MLNRPLAWLAVLIAVALAGCGGASTANHPSAEQQSVPASDTPLAVYVDHPSNDQRIVNGRFTVSGTASPDATRVTVEADPEHGATVTRRVRARGGAWSVRLPRFRDGYVVLYVSVGPGGGDGPSDDLKVVSVSTGVSPAVRARRAAHRQRAAFKHLLGDRAAVGLTAAAVRQALGSPDHRQNIAGQQYWYYNYNGNLVQLMLSGGVVSQVNAY